MEPMINAGEIDNFKEKHLPAFLNYVDFLIQSDELGLAEHLLYKGLPGYYRDHVPSEVQTLKVEFHKFLMTAMDYAANSIDSELVDLERGKEVVKSVLRGIIVMSDVEAHNKEGRIPHIVDFGPGEYWLPLGLKGHGLKFSYQGFGLCDAAQSKAIELMGHFDSGGHWAVVPKTDRPVMFVANEIIEHLRSPHEIPQVFHKTGLTAQTIHLSTPLYTFGRGNPTWRDEKNIGKGGHLRTFTPMEFLSIAHELFPRYNWVYCRSDNNIHNQIMSLKGDLRNG
jgi:hypothetical protein